MYEDGSCSAPASSTNNGSTDKTCFHHISTENKTSLKKKKLYAQCSQVISNVVRYTKSKAFDIWLKKRGEWISCRENVLQSSFVDVEQQQCDWTRQCLYDPTGTGPLVPPSAKYQSITRLVCGSITCARPCWPVLSSPSLNLPRCPCERK